jgi:hypothetical protein
MGLYVSLCVCECVTHLYFFNYISGSFRGCFIFVIISQYVRLPRSSPSSCVYDSSVLYTVLIFITV